MIETVKENKKVNTLYLVMVAFFTALTFVATFFANIPASFILGAGGNINLGDCVIFLSAVFIGPVGGAIAGAIGASMADVASSYVVYAPFTLVIKGLAGFMVGLLYRYILKNKKDIVKRFLSMLSGGVVIVIGYFFTEMIIGLIFGAGDTAIILLGLRTIIPNIIQVTASTVIAILVMPKIFPIYFRKSVQ